MWPTKFKMGHVMSPLSFQGWIVVCGWELLQSICVSNLKSISCTMNPHSTYATQNVEISVVWGD